ncbi:ER degradation-enhancing alpha-mannosidase-like protein 1 [Chytridiales sp. JEL 0842]|nr:ER degradation-enhancing alpha-mannosidase-like protein 1 [Chytridiales sp. JEL 0842]
MLAILCGVVAVSGMSKDRIAYYREKARDMFFHGYNGYMKHAYPMDELNPLTCTGRGPDRQNPNNWNINDVLGGFSITLVDNLDTLALLGNRTEFERAVKLVIDHVSFNVDSRVQVFEVTIRAMGGLLAAHMLATDKILGYHISWYKGELLHKAKDLADRLLPAFKTPTGIPYPRVNLKRGVLKHEVHDTCAAGAGTLLLEFGALSRLTGIDTYERVAKQALHEVWKRRSKLNLVGNTIHADTGQWIHDTAGIGAGIDSFYEYLLKAHILFGDDQYLDEFNVVYQGVMDHIKDSEGHFYLNVNMHNGKLVTTWVDSLSAFFPGLQVLAGDLDNAIRGHYVLYAIWSRFNAMPERFDFISRNVAIGHYPLRPELIESTYMLYQATGNHFYLNVGARMLEDIELHSKTKCGYAALQSVTVKTQDNRMESFFLAETVKYLYMLFDTDHIFNRRHSNYVFTTDLEVMSFDKTWLPLPENDIMNINHKVGLPGTANLDLVHGVYGVCYLATPYSENKNEKETFEITLSAPADHALALETTRVRQVRYNNIERSLSEGKSLEVSKRGISFLNGIDADDSAYQDPYSGSLPLYLRIDTITSAGPVSVDMQALLSSFGATLQGGTTLSAELVPLFDSTKGGTGVENLSNGCSVYSIQQQERVFGKVVIVKRGGCLFAQKVIQAETAGAVVLIVVNNDETLFIMDKGSQSWLSESSGAFARIPSLMISRHSGVLILKELKRQKSVAMRIAILCRDEDFWMSEEGQLQQKFKKLDTKLMYAGRAVSNLVIIDSGSERRTTCGIGKDRVASRGLSVIDEGRCTDPLKHDNSGAQLSEVEDPSLTLT